MLCYFNSTLNCDPNLRQPAPRLVDSVAVGEKWNTITEMKCDQRIDRFHLYLKKSGPIFLDSGRD